MSKSPITQAPLTPYCPAFAQTPRIQDVSGAKRQLLVQKMNLEQQNNILSSWFMVFFRCHDSLLCIDTSLLLFLACVSAAGVTADVRLCVSVCVCVH